MTALLTQLRELSSAEKILLAEELWDSVVDSPNLPSVTDSQKAELDRRLDTYAETPGGASWSDVKSRVQSVP